MSSSPFTNVDGSAPSGEMLDTSPTTLSLKFLPYTSGSVNSTAFSNVLEEPSFYVDQTSHEPRFGSKHVEPG